MKGNPSETARARKPLSFRVRTTTTDRLERHAKEVGETQTALVERYVEEGLRMDVHPLIHFRDGVGGRRPALLATRLDVWQVVETIRQNERSVEAAAAYLEIPVEHVRACLRYYADFQDEVDEWVARARAIETREDENWRRQQELLA
ncbi:MAG: DUF433 domain-containing protein [Gaiellaceae bacterium]